MRISFLLLLLTCSNAYAVADFSGVWSLPLCAKEKSGECGEARFVLLQKGQELCGDHHYYPANLGQLNEGFPGSVRGRIIGEQAILKVTSGRTAAIVRGVMLRDGKAMRWKLGETIKAGDGADDQILMEGLLRSTSEAISKELKEACSF